MVQGADILVGGLERELLRMSGWDERDPLTEARLERGLRLAILFSGGHALVPASGYFETACGYPVILRFRPSQERGQLVLQGSAGGPGEYISFKLDQWRGSSEEQKLYGEAAVRRIAALDSGAWRSKAEPTDNLIIVNWNAAIESGDHPLLEIFERAGIPSGRAEKAIAGIPDSLDGTVILVDNIIHHIRKPALRFTGQDKSRLRVHLARGFFGSHLNDSHATALVDPIVGMQEAVCPPEASKVRAHLLCEQLKALGHERLLLEQVDAEQFAIVAGSTAWRSLRPRLLARAESGVLFTAEEQRALRKAKSVPKGTGVPKPPAIEAALTRQYEALEKAERRAGTGPGPGTSVDGRERLARQMSASPFVVGSNGFATSGLQPAVDLDHISSMLLQVLEASNPDTARQLIRTFDATLEKYEDLRPEVVADLLKERTELADKVRTIPSNARRALYLVCVSASGSVLGKGLELGLKAMVGT